MLHNDYRKDWRNDDEFAKDIEESHKIERIIIDAYAEHLRIKHGLEVIIEDNGTDNSGAVVDSANTNADFKINGKPIEVKYNNSMDYEFRFKKDQLLSYLKQDACVLWVNGWLTDSPEFTVLKPSKLQEIKETRVSKPFKTWGYKRCYTLRQYLFKWYKFEGNVIDKRKR